MLSATSLVLTYLLSIPLGLWATIRSGSTAERTVSTVLYMLYSLPEFVAALYLQLLFYTKLALAAAVRHDERQLRHAFGRRPRRSTYSSTRCCRLFASPMQAWRTTARFIHANMQEVIRQDYIRTARAKGVPPWRVIWHHAFRNTLIPLVTLIGLTLPALSERGGDLGADIFVARHWPIVF